MKPLLVALALLMTAGPAANAQTSANSLADLQGKKRIILLFAKSRSDAGLDKQVELLRERRPDISERDLIVLVVEGTQDTIPAIGYAALPRGSGIELRRRFDPGTRFAGILIGKDGTEKLRWLRPVDPDTIFATIDAMPMRKQEAATN